MEEPPPKRLKISSEQDDEQETESEVEVLDNSAESDASTEATLRAEEDFEVIESPQPESNHEGEFEVIESSQPESSHEGEFLYVESEGFDEGQDQWWAAGPNGESQFLLLLEPAFVIELGNFGLSSGDPLPFGWVVDEDSLRHYAMAHASRD